MKKTLESFIDPQNIPKKYGGQLDFEFGYAGPTIDPMLDKYFEWKTEKKEYPMGPLFWRKAQKNGHGALELVASGSENGVERNEVVGVLQTSNTEQDLMNLAPGDEKSAEVRESSQTLQVPGQEAKKGVPAPLVLEAEDFPALETKAVENGEIVQENRPRLESFVTASEGTPLSPGYTGPVTDVQSPDPETQEATEQELANGVDTPEEPTSTETTAPVVNGEGTKTVEEKAESSPSSKQPIGDLGDKIRSSMESLSLAGQKRDLGGSEKGSVKSQKSLKDRIKEKLVK